MRQWVVRLKEGYFLSAVPGVWAVADPRKATKFNRAGAEAARRFVGEGALLAQVKSDFAVYSKGARF